MREEQLRQQGCALRDLLEDAKLRRLQGKSGGDGVEDELTRAAVLDMGQVVLCPEYMVAKRQRFGPGVVMPLEPYLASVLVHGTLHLLGHDHDQEDLYYAMRREEQWTMRRLWRERSQGRLPTLRL